MKKINRKVIFALSFITLISLSSIVSADESGITINLRRDVGTDLGDGRRMGGTWTLSGSGPEGTIKIVVLFNDIEVYTVQSRDYSFKFNTYEFPTGEVNITVRAYTTDTEFVSRSIIREFLPQSSETWILIGTAAIVVVALAIKYGVYRKRKQEGKKDISVDQIRIDG